MVAVRVCVEFSFPEGRECGFLPISLCDRSAWVWEIVEMVVGSECRMVLRSVYYHCRRNGWITWFIPSARVWTHRGRIDGCVR